MTKASTIDDAREAIADITATLEDMSVFGSDGQSAPNVAAARWLTGQLIRRLRLRHRRAQLLRRRLQ